MKMYLLPCLHGAKLSRLQSRCRSGLRNFVLCKHSIWITIWIISIQILGILRCNNDWTMNNNVVHFVVLNGYIFSFAIQIAIQFAIQIAIQIIFAPCKQCICIVTIDCLIYLSAFSASKDICGKGYKFRDRDTIPYSCGWSQ